MEKSRESGQRLVWLDVVRGLAAIIVYLQHTLERDSKIYEAWSWNWVNFGRVGVTAFFLVSGFVIPFSLERSNSLKIFWVSRFYRLFPFYWVVMAAAILCTLAGFTLVENGFKIGSPLHIGVNLTMIQQLVRIPNALPVFWTLGLEMLFYWILSAAFIFKFNGKSLHILYGIGAATLVAGIGASLILDRQFPGIGAMFLVVTACFGTVFYRYTEGLVSKRQILQSGAFVTLVMLVLAGIAFRHSAGLPGNENELIGPGSRIGSAIVGYALFFGVFAIRQSQMPKFLIHLGLVSYSIYLVHPFVWYFSPKFEFPIFTMALGFLITVALATATYHLIEAPFQAIGKRAIRAIRDREVSSAAPETPS